MHGCITESHAYERIKEDGELEAPSTNLVTPKPALTIILSEASHKPQKYTIPSTTIQQPSIAQDTTNPTFGKLMVDGSDEIGDFEDVVAQPTLKRQRAASASRDEDQDTSHANRRTVSLHVNACSFSWLRIGVQRTVNRNTRKANEEPGDSARTTKACRFRLRFPKFLKTL